MIIVTDLVIVGAGPAGMAAAISAKKSGIDDIVILERSDETGGILTPRPRIEPTPTVLKSSLNQWTAREVPEGIILQLHSLRTLT